jgi:hypothetical protein
MMHVPMDPDHNREARLACKATRAGNVQVETLGLDFLQMLSGTLVAGEGKEFLLICFAFWLWADGPVGVTDTQFDASTGEERTYP